MHDHTDPAAVRELVALTQPDRLVEGKHACPVSDCGLSAEEHHALTGGTFALMLEVRQLRQQIDANDTAK
jgi:hypothetical protein